MTATAIQVFFSYSHLDGALQDELAKSLKLLERQHIIQSWHDRRISAGTEWANQIDDNLNSANIILLLVSANFLASDYCYDLEMKRAMERHEAKEARVIPIILKPCRWQRADFGGLQALPKDGKPVTDWKTNDDAFVNIVEGIEQVAEELTSPPAPLLVPPFPRREGGLGGLGQFDFETATISLQSGKVNIQRRTGRAQQFIENLPNGITLEMVEIPGGIFYMGSPDNEEGRSDRESPQHLVTVPPFYMGKYPVTQAQWFVVANLPKIEIDLNPNPAYFKGVNLPVESISWYDAVEFCRRLSRATGKEYRLPSEAQWEYACRAISPLSKGGEGGYQPFYFGETVTTDLANYNGNYTYGAGVKGQYRTRTTDVGSFPANPFGLYDMCGNVLEWCADTWHENYQGAPIDGSAWIEGGDGSRSPLRGGSWYNNPLSCRSTNRFNFKRCDFSPVRSFRVVCVFGRTP